MNVQTLSINITGAEMKSLKIAFVIYCMIFIVTIVILLLGPEPFNAIGMGAFAAFLCISLYYGISRDSIFINTNKFLENNKDKLSSEDKNIIAKHKRHYYYALLFMAAGYIFVLLFLLHTETTFCRMLESSIYVITMLFIPVSLLYREMLKKIIIILDKYNVLNDFPHIEEIRKEIKGNPNITSQGLRSNFTWKAVAEDKLLKTAFIIYCMLFIATTAIGVRLGETVLTAIFVGIVSALSCILLFSVQQMYTISIDTNKFIKNNKDSISLEDKNTIAGIKTKYKRKCYFSIPLVITGYGLYLSAPLYTANTWYDSLSGNLLLMPFIFILLLGLYREMVLEITGVLYKYNILDSFPDIENKFIKIKLRRNRLAAHRKKNKEKKK